MTFISVLVIASSLIIFAFKKQVIFLILPALLLAVMLLSYLARKNPEAKWVKILFSKRKLK